MHLPNTTPEIKFEYTITFTSKAQLEKFKETLTFKGFEDRFKVLGNPLVLYFVPNADYELWAVQCLVGHLMEKHQIPNPTQIIK